MIDLIIALFALAYDQPRITNERIGDGRFRLHLEAPGISAVEEGLRLLGPEARRLCAGTQPYFGRYRFEALETMQNSGGPRRPVKLILHQDLYCGSPPPDMAQQEPGVANPDWQASPAEEEAVRAATRAYFAAKDGGRYAEAHALMTASNQASMPLTGFSANAASLNAQIGAPRGRTLIRVTWYNDPPGAPPGVYGAVDFNGDFANLHSMCGYVIWQRQHDGSWRLVREEQYVIARADAPDATPDEIARLRARTGCRD